MGLPPHCRFPKPRYLSSLLLRYAEDVRRGQVAARAKQDAACQPAHIRRPPVQLSKEGSAVRRPSFCRCGPRSATPAPSKFASDWTLRHRRGSLHQVFSISRVVQVGPQSGRNRQSWTIPGRFRPRRRRSRPNSVQSGPIVHIHGTTLTNIGHGPGGQIWAELDGSWPPRIRPESTKLCPESTPDLARNRPSSAGCRHLWPDVDQIWPPTSQPSWPSKCYDATRDFCKRPEQVVRKQVADKVFRKSCLEIPPSGWRNSAFSGPPMVVSSRRVPGPLDPQAVRKSTSASCLAAFAELFNDPGHRPKFGRT